MDDKPNPKIKSLDDVPEPNSATMSAVDDPVPSGPKPNVLPTAPPVESYVPPMDEINSYIFNRVVPPLQSKRRWNWS